MSNREEKLTELRNLVLSMVKAIVDHPEQVSYKEAILSHNGVLEVTVAHDEYGQAIGRGGQNAQAMRTILNAACNKADVKYTFEVVHPERP